MKLHKTLICNFRLANRSYKKQRLRPPPQKRVTRVRPSAKRLSGPLCNKSMRRAIYESDARTTFFEKLFQKGLGVALASQKRDIRLSFSFYSEYVKVRTFFEIWGLFLKAQAHELKAWKNLRGMMGFCKDRSLFKPWLEPLAKCRSERNYWIYLCLGKHYYS